MGQVFYFTARKGTNEADSVRFPVQAGKWEDVRVPLPPLEPGTGLRLDPPGGTGNTVLVASLGVEPRILLKAPAWPPPDFPGTTGGPLSLRSGAMQLSHAAGKWGGFQIDVGEQSVAV